jgi:hypothetical protein
MLANGWEATLREFKGNLFAAPSEKKSGATIGEFLDELATVADLKPKTLRGYSVAFRTILSQIFHIDGGKGRHYFAGEARQKWLDRIHAIKLADVTPFKVQAWKREFLARAGSDPVKLRTAKISVNSLIRRAKALFAADTVRHLQRIQLPDPLPFAGVAFEPRVSQRYQSTIDIEALIAAARTELQESQPDGILRIQATKHFFA